MPKEDYIPVCEYDKKYKCNGTRWFQCQHGGDSGLNGQGCDHVVYALKEYTISKLEDSLEKAKEIIRFAMTLEKRPTFISINFCRNGDAYVNLSYDEDENKGE